MDLEAFVALRVEEADGRGSRISDVLDSTDDVGSTNVSDVLSPERSLGLRLKPQGGTADEEISEDGDRSFPPDVTGDSSMSQHSIAELAHNLSFSALHTAINELSGEESKSPQRDTFSQHPMAFESTLSSTKNLSLSQYPYDLSRGDQSSAYSVLSQHRLSEMHTALDTLVEATAEIDKVAAEKPEQLDDVLEVQLSKPTLLMPMEFSARSKGDSDGSSPEISAIGTRPQTVIDCNNILLDGGSKRSSFGDEAGESVATGFNRTSIDGPIGDVEEGDHFMSSVRESEIYHPSNGTIGDTLLVPSKHPVSSSTPNRHSDGYDIASDNMADGADRPSSAPFQLNPDVKTIMTTVGIDDYMSEGERGRVLECIQSTPVAKEPKRSSGDLTQGNEEASVFRLQSYETHDNLAALSVPNKDSMASHTSLEGQMLHDLDPVQKTSYWVATSPIVCEDEKLSPPSSLGSGSLASRPSMDSGLQSSGSQHKVEEEQTSLNILLPNPENQPYLVRENACLELFTKPNESKRSESHPSSRSSYTDNIYQRSVTDSLLRYDRGELHSIGSDSSKPEDKQADTSIPSLSSASSRVSTDRLSEVAREHKRKELAEEFETIEKQGLDESSNSKSSARSRDSNEISSLTNVTKPDSARSSMECFYMSSPFGGDNIKELDTDQEHREVEQQMQLPEVITDVHSLHEQAPSNRSSIGSASSKHEQARSNRSSVGSTSSKHEQAPSTRSSIGSSSSKHEQAPSTRSSIGSTSSKHSVRIQEHPERLSLPFETFDEEADDTSSRRKSLSERVSDILASAPAQDLESIESPRLEEMQAYKDQHVTPDRGSVMSEEDDIDRLTGEYKAILKGVTAANTGEISTDDIQQATTTMKDDSPPEERIDERGRNRQNKFKRQPLYEVETSDTEDGLDRDVRRILAKYGRRLSDTESENQSRASPIASNYDTDDTLSGRVHKLLLKKSGDLGGTQATLECVPTYMFDDPSKSMTLPDLGSTAGSEDSLQVILVKNKAKEKEREEFVKSKKTLAAKELDPLHSRVKQILAVTNYLEEGQNILLQEDGSAVSSRTPSRTSSVDYEMLEKDLNEIQLNLESIKDGSMKSNTSSNKSGRGDQEESAEEETFPVSSLLTRDVVPIDVALDNMHGPETDQLRQRSSYSSPDLRTHATDDENTSDDQRRIEAKIYGYYEKLKEEKRREVIEEEKRRQILMGEKRREILREEKRKETFREEQKEQDLRKHTRQAPMELRSLERQAPMELRSLEHQPDLRRNMRQDYRELPHRVQKPPIPQDERRSQSYQSESNTNTRPSPSRPRPAQSSPAVMATLR